MEVIFGKGINVKNIIHRMMILMSCVIFISCATSQSRFVALTDEKRAGRPQEAEVEVFKDGLPSRPFKRISRLDVHLEKSHFVGSTLDDALPLLKKFARQSGAEAIIEIKERSSHINETKIFHVTAIGIVFTDN